MTVNPFTMAGFQQAAKKVMASKLLMFYIGFTLLYCGVQTALTARAYIDNSGPEQRVKALLRENNALNATIPIIDGNKLDLCSSSASQQDFLCHVVWDGEARQNSLSRPLNARGGVFDIIPGVADPVKLTFEGITMDLDQSCLWSLNYVRNELAHSKRENIAFLTFQVWVFVISTVGVMADSVPHLFASLATHALIVAWGVFQIVQTMSFQASFKRIITDGACAGAQILPDLFTIRSHTDIPLLAVNLVALLFSAFLTLRLVKHVNWHNFKTVGANLQMNNHRRFMLILFTSIQLSFFFVTAFATLLFDEVLQGNMSQMASFITFYRISCIASLLVLVPWMLCGIYGVEHEKKVPTSIFIAYSIFWLAGFATMFFSTSFRLEITHWPFFAAMGAMSVLLTAVALILAIICLLNFGKGYMVAKNIGADTAVDQRARSWGDLESSPYEEKLAAMPTFGSDVPQFPTTFEPPRVPPAAMNIPQRFLTPSPGHKSSSSTSSIKLSAGKLHKPGFSLSDSRGPSKRRDSTASFGNMDGWGTSPPGTQSGFSSTPGSSFSVGVPSFSAAPRAAPALPPNQLGRMGGTEPTGTWATFGHNIA